MANLIELRDAYARNENVLRRLRQGPGNDPLSILISYDLQAGTYVEALKDEAHRATLEAYAQAISDVIRTLEPGAILEAGVGEATTLRQVWERLNKITAYGFDLSWSRIHVARQQYPYGLFVAEMEAIPLPDHAIDVVYTAHSIEPNHGREASILQELYRVAGRYLVLFEPAYEFASLEGRKRMEEHGYCRGLFNIAQGLGWTVLRHDLLDVSLNPLNPTGCLVIQKRRGEPNESFLLFICPSCGSSLEQAHGHYFCAAEGLTYPVLRGIPCLARFNAVLCGKFNA